ncbi:MULTISPECIES: CoA-disulfide reductase [Bacillus]|uniref:CoA-disulfide reductase n=1 Tax=Bacillus TaxID=1386 RepID=UPI002243FF23|nr:MULTISPECIES: CoA-disulfide reductase [Bacillus]MDN5388452.1 CoA-disulfide reductase [Bacillus sp. LB7]MEC1023186.1 CoA-disulfide reductase [Bacillus paralicheniformis]MEC1025752.1 CoA-disulfide reductase [Bacillus paralicheniformis]MEC1035832.1 CoA-disulfide reductase [Bacillus paralicheniformis]MEC1050030.1 CoA-disulfide reductase [Bacillus paralicheniformis]
MNKKIVIIGGVAGGATTAARLRRLDEQAHIVLFERGEYIAFANCGLPYYIGETIKSREKLLVQTAEGMSKKFNLDIRIRSEVVKINRDKKTVTVNDLAADQIYEENYDTLVLSPGAKPIVPPIPGLAEADNLFTLRTIPDTDQIKNYIDSHNPKKAVVIGGGFIGLEMAENLVGRGIHVTLVEMSDQVMAPLDYEMAAVIHKHLHEKGVTLILKDGVQSFSDKGKKVILSSGKVIDPDFTVLSIGVTPENALAVEAGLRIGPRGGIQVNEKLQTSDKHIYAIGDAIETADYVHQQPAFIPLAGPANRQGRIAANNIYGKQETYKGTLGTSIAKIFDLTAAVTGSNEKTLKQHGIDYKVVHIHPASHAGYYPGASQLALKIIFSPHDGMIYGAQAIGKDGADKRIDVIATAMKGDLTVFELTELELAYAPPFSSAKDPVNMAGYVASNMVEDGLETVQWHEIDKIVERGGFLIDVREPHERKAGYIKGSVNIPLGEIRDRQDEIPNNQPIYVACQVGLRGYLAARILLGSGYRAINLDGGWKTYSYVNQA